MKRPKGIKNITQVSCHINCALQILLHATGLFSELLIEYSNYNDEKSGFIAGLCSILCNGLAEEGDESGPIDPSHLYGLLENKASINPDDLGDAVTAFRRILQATRQDFSKIDCLSDSMENLFDGTVQQEIVGFKNNKKRIKATSRKLVLPLSIPGNETSLEEALLHATIRPIKEIKGYSWVESGNHVESEVTDEEKKAFFSNKYESFDDWKTFKKVLFEKVPIYLILHMQRFTLVDGTVTPFNTTMSVPLTMDISPFHKLQQKNEYYLRGAILHVLDLSVDDDDDDENENGHYISVVFVDNVWFLIDDDIVVEFANNQEMIDILEGRCSTFAHLKHCHFTSVLLTYQNEKSSDSENWQENFMKRIKFKLSEMKSAGEVEDEYNESLVGKRLRVRWSKGKYYRGFISNYESETGRHTVKYDDGDMRVYKLSQKTIEWE